MKASSLTASFLLAAALGGCGDSEPVPVGSGVDAPVVELPARQATVSGMVFDPEALYVQYMSTEEPGDDPGVFDGIPYLAASVVPEARVRLYGPGLTDVTSDASSGGGHWQVQGVLSNDTVPYVAEAIPPEGGVVFHSDESTPFEMPPATYYPTTHLRPIQVSRTQCIAQTALMVGSAGALDAVAQHLTAQGTATTVADLVNPARTGGVVLFWVHTPSFFYDFYLGSLDEVAGEASAGTLLALDWAAPEGLPGQSPLGFSVLPDPVSHIGYFALVLPPGATQPVQVTFTDTHPPPAPEEEMGPYGFRPLPIEPFTVTPRPGISVQRVRAGFNYPPHEPDPLEDPHPPEEDVSWLCQAPPPPDEHAGEE
ncbi:hypothetical protein [Pyxidicoccus xibeiensis]|uniref:hypothetical protein n=1 Tax=Pyxidicoccus xibeiensis TaxID=2906759 RepID=UPI0020A7B44D|nr:hypothetical protein [Pyxidicoccus xibeiensis]MCP3138666.1 hypothetical protein [Pyxidicoccus xibeiensis]